jgi:hypothetical protein
MLDSVKIANKTARCNGAVGKNAIVPKWIAENVPHYAYVLDFGSGPKIPHTLALREKGFFNVFAYDFGENHNDNHLDRLYTNNFGVIFASNVFNTHSNALMSAQALHLIKESLVDHGFFVFNLPYKPNYFWTDKKAFFKLVIEIFGVKPIKVNNKGVYVLMRDINAEKLLL